MAECPLDVDSSIDEAVYQRRESSSRRRNATRRVDRPQSQTPGVGFQPLLTREETIAKRLRHRVPRRRVRTSAAQRRHQRRSVREGEEKHPEDLGPVLATRQAKVREEGDGLLDENTQETPYGDLLRLLPPDDGVSLVGTVTAEPVFGTTPRTSPSIVVEKGIRELKIVLDSPGRRAYFLHGTAGASSNTCTWLSRKSRPSRLPPRGSYCFPEDRIVLRRSRWWFGEKGGFR